MQLEKRPVPREVPEPFRTQQLSMSQLNKSGPTTSPMAYLHSSYPPTTPSSNVQPTSNMQQLPPSPGALDADLRRMTRSAQRGGKKNMVEQGLSMGSVPSVSATRHSKRKKPESEGNLDEPAPESSARSKRSVSLQTSFDRVDTQDRRKVGTSK